MEYKGAGVIIFCNNSFIIVEGNQNIYSFPKGHIRKSINETLEECASRELYEETGIYYSPECFNRCTNISIYEYIYYIIVVDEQKCNFNIQDKKEILSCRWFNISELLSIYYKCNQGIKKILSNWNYYREIFNSIEPNTDFFEVKHLVCLM